MNPTTLNADPAELAKFSELAHRWWDLDSEFRVARRFADEEPCDPWGHRAPHALRL